MHNEKIEMYSKIYKKLSTILESLDNFCKDNEKYSLQELSIMSDILKDVSYVEKNLTKACYYSKDVDENILKKY